MNEEAPTFKYNNITIPVTFGYKEVMGDFKKMGLNLLKLFEDQSVMTSIFMNDELMLEVWFHYVKNYATSMDEAVEHLTPQQMHVFKEAFWQAVVNFTAPQMRPTLIALKAELDQVLKSPAKNLRSSSFDSSEEQE
jgi:hypothetical protein